MTATRAWCLSDTMLDTLVIMRKVTAVAEPLILQQLRSSGVRNRRKQQKRFLDTGVRSYPMWDFYDNVAAKKAFREYSQHMFDDSHWVCIHQRTEATSLRLFRSLSAAACSTYELAIVKGRRWDVKIYNFLRWEEDTQRDYDAAPVCTYGEYVGTIHERFGKELSNPVCKAELWLGLMLSESDTADCERMHSRNERRRKHRVWNSSFSFSVLSAWATVDSSYGEDL